MDDAYHVDLLPWKSIETGHAYIDHRILQYRPTHAVVMYCGLSIPAVGSILQLPHISTFVELQFRIVVAFVEVFQYCGEDLRLLVWQVDAFRGPFKELAS